ncbi:MAG: TIM barrel protein [Oscillospiraceae bacterium]|nr:TIM barrel protein [Oscillospiraceae bacterium]
MLDKISLSGQMFDALPVWDHLEAAAAFGYKAIELRSTHAKPDSDRAYLTQIRSECAARGLRILSLSCFTGNYGLFDDDGCEKAFSTFCDYVGLADFMGAECVRLWPAWQASETAPEAVRARAAQWTMRSCEYAAQHGKKVVLEMHHGTLCDTLASCEDLIRRIGCDNCGFILDPVNLYQVPAEDVKPYIRALKDRIFIVHVKDIIRLPSGDFPYAFPYSFYAQHIGRFTPVVPPDPSRTEFYAHRRINHGGVDWAGIFRTLEEVGYDGYLTVESVNETNRLMPSGRALARACMRDIREVLSGQSADLSSWNIVSPQVPGVHEVISPATRDCRVSNILRINLRKGETCALPSGEREMNALLVSGSCGLALDGREYEMGKLDSFYMPGGSEAKLTAREDCSFYVGCAVCEGYGKPFFRKLDLSLPVGDIHQIHGSGPMAREVFFTLDPGTPASRLLCGISWGGKGGWTSWPPHQHEKDLEEVYCYFDTELGAQVPYRASGAFDDMELLVVRSGHMVLAPSGYHPTVAFPCSSNAYFWVLTAFSHESRRYDLAVPDPAIRE